MKIVNKCMATIYLLINVHLVGENQCFRCLFESCALLPYTVIRDIFFGANYLHCTLMGPINTDYITS